MLGASVSTSGAARAVGAGAGYGAGEEEEGDRDVDLEGTTVAASYVRVDPHSLMAMPEGPLMIIATFLDAYSLVRAGRSCHVWQKLSLLESLWKPLCRHAVAPQPLANMDAFKAQRRSLPSWRDMFPHIPQVRTDGAYVLRHSYVRKGHADMFSGGDHGVLLVVTHRVFRFYADGRLQFAHLPGDPAEHVIMQLVPGTRSAKVYSGRWHIDGARLSLEVAQPNATIEYQLQLHTAHEYFGYESSENLACIEPGTGINNLLAVEAHGIRASDGLSTMPVTELLGQTFHFVPSRATIA